MAKQVVQFAALRKVKNSGRLPEWIYAHFFTEICATKDSNPNLNRIAITLALTNITLMQ